jgi:Glyoxalase-like domain
MPTRLVHMVIDAAEPGRQAAFWAAALGWQVLDAEPGLAAVGPADLRYPDAAVVPLAFLPVPVPKHGKNRIHIDLCSESAQGQADTVTRLRRLGAEPADIGQGDVPWVVLADPEGNEFCVLEPRPAYRDTGPIAAIVVDAADPAALAGFWAAASGWQPQPQQEEGLSSLRSPAGAGPYLEFLGNPSVKAGKNRLHLDVAPPPGGDQRAEAARLEAAGASRADIGQGDVPWVVLADPEGNEFCVLTPR